MVIMYRTKHNLVNRVRPRLVCGVSVTDASFENECRIDRILYKYTHNIPLEQWQLKKSAAVYADVSQMPKDPAELREYMENKREIWEDLPAEIRRQYNDDMYNFMAECANNPDALREKIDSTLAAAKADISSIKSQLVTGKSEGAVKSEGEVKKEGEVKNEA